MSSINPSIINIAKEANVSAMTVSRILNGYQPTRAAAVKRAEQIREIAKRIGYKKNSAPLAMLKGRFDTIAILGSDIHRQNNLPEERMNGILDVLHENGKKLMIFRESDKQLTSDEYIPSILSERMVDGLLIDYVGGVPQKMVDLVRHSLMPTIWMNRKEDVDCVYFDDFQAAYQIAMKYIKKGYKRITLLLPESPEIAKGKLHYSLHDRECGYRQAMDEVGLKADVLFEDAKNYNTQPEKIFPLLQSSKRPQVIITYMIYQAMNVLSCANHIGLKVPEDIALATFSKERSLSRALRIPAMLNPEYELGVKATEMLLQKINEPKECVKSAVFPLAFDNACLG